MTELEKKALIDELSAIMRDEQVKVLRESVEYQQDRAIEFSKSQLESKTLHDFRCASLSGSISRDGRGYDFEGKQHAEFAESAAQAMLKIARGDK